ncbi:MAG: hypothetical protein DRG80_04015, partial [Deltaproteobacteria bacterium]
ALGRRAFGIGDSQGFMGLVAEFAVSLDHVISMGFMAAYAVRYFAVFLMAGCTSHGAVKAFVLLQLCPFSLMTGEAGSGNILGQFQHQGCMGV